MLNGPKVRSGGEEKEDVTGRRHFRHARIAAAGGCSALGRVRCYSSCRRYRRATCVGRAAGDCARLRGARQQRRGMGRSASRKPANHPGWHGIFRDPSPGGHFPGGGRSRNRCFRAFPPIVRKNRERAALAEPRQLRAAALWKGSLYGFALDQG